MSTPPPTIVLVHGAWHGAWCWSALLPALAERGIAARAVDLTSHGHDPATVGDLRSDADLVTELASSIDGPVVLLGHSYGGVVITEMAERLDNVRQLIYLSAFVPDAGEAMVDITGGGRAPWITFADGLMTVDQGWGSKLFYSDCDPDVAADAEGALQPQSHLSFQQCATAAGWQKIRSLFIRCTEDLSVPEHLSHHFISKIGVSLDFPGGHSPFLSQPQRLAGVLAERV